MVALASITIDPAAIAQTANYLGDSQFTADPPFAGALDDFRIYNRGLTPSEVAELALPPAAIPVPLDYTGWTTGIAFSAGQGATLADPDNDGVQNAFEFILGFNPLVANPAAFPTPQVRTGAQLGLTGDPTGRYLTLQVRVRQQDPGTNLFAEAASDIPGLGLPDAASHARVAGTPILDGEFEIVTYYYDVPIEDSADGSGFMRFRATIE
jgi:hypothetical protein